MLFYGWRKTPPPDEVSISVKLTRSNLGWVASGGILHFFKRYFKHTTPKYKLPARLTLKPIF